MPHKILPSLIERRPKISAIVILKINEVLEINACFFYLAM